MATHETLKQTIPELIFSPEGYIADNGPEFYQQLVAFLKEAGFDPDNLLYSGTDAARVLNQDGSVIPSKPGIFAMNEAGWLRAIKGHETTPAAYADKEGGHSPAIALYDRSQMAHAYDYNVQMEDEMDYSSAVDPSDIVPGEKLEDLPLDSVVEELVIHKNFPEALPSDALVGLVQIVQPASGDSNDHGL